MTDSLLDRLECLAVRAKRVQPLRERRGNRFIYAHTEDQVHIGTSLHNDDGPGWRQASPSPREEPALLSRDVLDELHDLVGAESFGAFLAQVHADLCAAAEGIAQAWDAGDLAGLRRHSHAMIGVAGAIGATEAEEGARALNLAARAADTEGARERATALCRLSEVLCQEIARKREGQRPL